MTDLTGFWRFKEEFDYGEKVGEARLFQEGNHITGNLIFKERLHEGDSMMVRTILSGSCSEGKVTLNDTGYAVLFGHPDDEYLLEEREGALNNKGQIVGSVMDKDAVGGVFVMDRIF